MPGVTMKGPTAAVLAALVAASALVACSPSEHAASSRSSVTPTASATATTPAPKPVAPAGLVVDRWLDTNTAGPTRTDASGRARAVDVRGRGGKAYGVLALGPGGRLLVERFTMPHSEDLVGKPRIGWLTHSGFEPLQYPDGGGAPSQITGASFDGRRVVWSENTSTQPADDWRIYTANTNGAGRTLVADTVSVYGEQFLDPPLGQTMPVLLGSKVYWATVPPSGRFWPDTLVLVDDLDGSSARPRVLKGAMLPASNGRRVFLVRQKLPDPSKGAVRIVARTAQGEESVVQRFRVSAGQTVTALAASRTHLAWVVSNAGATSTLYVEDLATHRVTGIAMHHAGGSSMALGVGRDRIAWGNGSANEGEDPGEYVFRPRTGKLVRLGQLEGHSFALAYDRWITWTPQSRQHGFHITTYMVSH